MKRIKMLVVLVFLVLLSGCFENKNTFEKVESAFVLTYDSSDSENNVTKDVSLPDLEDKFSDIEVTYTSSNQTVAIIEGLKIKIMPTEVDVTIKITLTVTINDKQQSFDRSFIVKAKPQRDDTYTLVIVDNDNQSDYAVLKDSLFNQILSKEGFDFAGLYLDQAFTKPFDGYVRNNLTVYVKWIKVTLDQTAPNIIGVENLTIFLGDSIDLLRGITVTDNLDGSPQLWVDDSEVDYFTPGVYKVYYYAVDSSDNERIVEATLTIKNEVNLSTLETFEQSSGSGSSYTNGSFQSENGLIWVYEGMRGDQILDGKALTFGQSSSQFLKTIIPNGVNSVSIDFKHVFSGASTRNVDLYLNNELRHTFLVTADTMTYEVINLGVQGEVTFELRNASASRVIIDNILITHNQLSDDMKSVLKDQEALVLPSKLMFEQQLSLVNIGNYGSAISYHYQDALNPYNHLIDLISGEVILIENQVKTIGVVVTIRKGTEEVSFTHAFIIGEGDPITISEAKTHNGLVKTTGVLTGFITTNNQVRAFFEDADTGIEVYLDVAFIPELEIGYSYIIKGNVTGVKEKQLTDVTSLIKQEQTVIYPTNYDPQTPNETVGKNIYFEGLFSDINNHIARIVVGQEVVLVDMSYLSTFDFSFAEVIEVLGYVVYENNNYYIVVLEQDDIQTRPSDLNRVNDLVLEHLGLNHQMTISDDLVLKYTDERFGLSISYQSSNQSILSNDGKIITLEAEESVLLNYTLSKNSTIIYQSSIAIEIRLGNPLTGYYQEANGKIGDELLRSLTTIISRNYHSISYSATNKVLEVSDKHPSGSGYLGVYDHTSISGYNKEHVWPQSSFSEASPYRSDMHHLRISVVSTNSARSNYYFNNPTSPTSNWQVGSSRFFPGDQDKGDIARMLLYMAVRYRNDNFKLIVAESGRTSNAPSRTMGNLAVLLNWHLEDPVDSFEVNRNEVIYGTQKNRNPFIDHPELFESIWTIFMQEDSNRKISFNNLDPDFLMSYIELKIFEIQVDLGSYRKEHQLFC